MKYDTIISDAQIAELIGVTLNGRGLKDLPALARISQFRDNFEALLEDKLANAERNGVLKVAKEISFQSLTDAITERLAGRLKYAAFTIINTNATEQADGDLFLELQVSMYTGDYNPRAGLGAPKDRSDANFAKDTLEGLSKNSLDSIEGLYMERQGFPRIKSLRPPVKSPAGSPLPSTHVVDATYTTLIPANMLPEVYNKHKSLLTQA